MGTSLSVPSPAAAPPVELSLADRVKQELKRLYADTNEQIAVDQLPIIAKDEFVSAVVVLLVNPLTAPEANEARQVLYQLCKLVYQPAEYSVDDGRIDSHGCLESALNYWQGPQGSHPIQAELNEQKHAVSYYSSQASRALDQLERFKKGHAKFEDFTRILHPDEYPIFATEQFMIDTEESEKQFQSMLEDKCRTLDKVVSNPVFATVRKLMSTSQDMGNVARLERLFAQSSNRIADPQAIEATTIFDSYRELYSLDDYSVTDRVKTNGNYSCLKANIAWSTLMLWWKAMADRPKDAGPARLRLNAQLTDFLSPAAGASPRLVALAKIEELIVAMESKMDDSELARLSVIASEVDQQLISRLELVEYLQSSSLTMTEDEYRNAVFLAISKFWLEVDHIDIDFERDFSY